MRQQQKLAATAVLVFSIPLAWALCALGGPFLNVPSVFGAQATQLHLT